MVSTCNAGLEENLNSDMSVRQAALTCCSPGMASDWPENVFWPIRSEQFKRFRNWFGKSK